MRTCQINPSILSADFTNLERELHRIHTADAVHVDVMDNHFVPNLTIGLPVVQRLNEVSDLPLDVHLMINDVDRWGPGYARGRRGLGDLPRGGLRGPGEVGQGLAGRRCARLDGLASRDAHRTVPGHASGAGHGAADDGGTRLRRTGLP